MCERTIIWKDQKGAAAVEFAIVLPLLLTLVFGIIEFSLAMYDKAMITNASREGARFGIVYRVVADPVNTGETMYQPPTEAEILEVVNNYLGDNLVTFGESTGAAVTRTFDDNDASGALSSGDSMTVTVDYTYGYLVIPNFIGDIAGPLNMRATTVMMME